jgi:hypothetical protein
MRFALAWSASAEGIFGMSFARPPIFIGRPYDPADQLRKQDAAWKQLALVGSRFLKAAFPDVDYGHADALAEAFIGVVCCNSEEQIKNLEQQKLAMESFDPKAYPFTIKSDEERLIQLIEDRDKKTAQIQTVQDSLDDFPESTRSLIQATGIQPLQEQLAMIDEQISSVQKSIERKSQAIPEANPQRADTPVQRETPQNPTL